MTGQLSGALADCTAQLRAAFVAPIIDEHRLIDAACAYVDAARTLGWRVERVIIEVKRIAVVEDGPIFRAMRDPMRREEAHALVDRVITRCINHYYSDVRA
ncbi:MAG TPA: hypothetical protein VEB19_05320 [Gemmatimonadaceae bacterium]|nr:hypothetical protein [Gemmatimonadaceae bacterium]